MKWENWTKAQLRIYLCRNIEIERIKKELERVDEVNTPITNYTPSESQRTPHRQGSVVEFSVLQRIKVKEHLERQKEWHLKRVEVVQKALDSLTPFHRTLIEKAYFSMDYATDRIIGESVNLPKWAVQAHKRAALSHLYDAIMDGYQETRKEFLKAGDSR